MDKIKAFFSNKITKIVAWVVLCICAVILIIGGATAESISGGVALVAGIVSAVSALISFIGGMIKKE
ncbi:MAG: hypothetical protein MJ174_07410 [Treponema sp.]|nr:hypothetical protein [Treponema sp.]